MPRKFITQEVKDQNRESQRRSRARRAELINDLKKQVQDFQQQGASASLKMQRVAQAVTLENQRLRSLLSVHGVSQDEINRFISPPPATSPGSPDGLLESGALKCKACGSTSIMLQHLPAVLSPQHQNYHTSPQIMSDCALPSPSISCDTVELSRMGSNTDMGVSPTAFYSPPANQVCHSGPSVGNIQEARKPRKSQSQENSKRQCCESRSNESNKPHSENPSEDKLHPATLHPLPNPTASEAISSIDSMETSCDTAASILVDLHHGMDNEQARTALGCKGSETCNVSNIKIFQLLEKFD
ncbi:BZIP domain-containing protein [Trichoderma simmonsii]|uniref:BZIP domain-containing protein n=1 Tax=Trichoderma simmonsii TaxID=1491479 RepID=A0A8G0PI10_9HYPO|nr:BZIP domain-containing protein [Trichoderma simmonsii]